MSATATDEVAPRPWAELLDSGLLWLINRQVFHPHGFSLSVHTNEHGEPTGWALRGDGTEIHAFPYELEQEYFERAMAEIEAARSQPK
ncbi:hypothetical protein [Agromyces sp. SYSU T00194]|uniref:hypothetical protein n=1 Tax=Agromyces chitinivorans TaxID=3158560 RepID=UPI0033981048